MPGRSSRVQSLNRHQNGQARQQTGHPRQQTGHFRQQTGQQRQQNGQHRYRKLNFFQTKRIPAQNWWKHDDNNELNSC